MEKLLMKKTVYDGKIYHKAGELVEVSNEVAKWYLGKNFAAKLDSKIVEELEEMEAEIEKESEAIESEIETKEEKKVYRKRK
jgi:ribosomal protein L9